MNDKRKKGPDALTKRLSSNGKKAIFPITATLLIAAMLFTMTLPAFAFTGEVYDPKTLPELQPESSNWAKEELMQAKQAELIVDGLGGNYKTEITRSQFCALVTNLVEKAVGEQLPAPEASPFDDTSEVWILKANAAGIVSGTSASTFNPAASITREQIASMLHRAMTYIEKETGVTKLTAGGSLSAYSDAGQVSGWAKDSVTVLTANGIMKGTSDTQLSPKGTTTIEQAVLLALRVFNIFASAE